MKSFSASKFGEIFTAFLIIGMQSFGGGTSTLYLIRQACIQRKWMDDEEFTRSWALVQIAPGINLVKLTILVGYRLMGWTGLVASTLGLLMPSAVITVLMTAGFSAIRDNSVVQAAMKGILPATIGFSLAMAIQMAHPILANAQKEGPARLATNVLFLAAAAMLLSLANLSPALVLLLAGAAAVPALALVQARPVEGKP